MAATIIKQEVIGSEELKTFARRMGWDIRTALGALAFLWSGSQNRKISRRRPR
jgi:hypothetical protein